VWEKDDELRKEGGGVGENGGLLMRGKGCWRLGGSVTEISKTREAAGGWLRLEDEGMKKRWKGRGAGVFFGRLRGRRKTKGKKTGLGEKGLLVLWSSLSPCVFFFPLSFSLPFFSSPSSFYRQGKPCGDNGIRDKP
jgi:hypothetical protein